MLDIKKILGDNRIYWTDKGHNVSRGNINIKCPMCGPDDPSEHMGIRLTDGAWACWRNSRHSGRNIQRLLALLNIYVTDDLSDTIQQLVNRTYFGNQEIDTKAVAIAPKKMTDLPMEFISIEDESIFTRPYLQYLKARGFSDPLAVCKQYDLRFSIAADKWTRRLIIPVWVGDEVTWTGRAIGDNPLRYMSPKVDEARNIKDCLFNYNRLLKTEGEVLIIVEGPIDAITIETYNEGIHATALFGLSIPKLQVKLLKNICPNFKTILIGLDQGTLIQSFQLMRELQDFSPIAMRLPEKDFNAMSPMENKELVARYLS